MDDSISNALKNLEDIYESHPNLSTLWREFILIKIKNLEETIVKSNVFIEKSKHISDFDKYSIITLLMLKNINRHI